MLFRRLVYLAILAERIIIASTSASADSQTLLDYDQLHKACTSGCCESSVEQMRSTKSLLKNGAEPCPPGYQANMYRCPGSYSWCEPAKVGADPEVKVSGEQDKQSASQKK